MSIDPNKFGISKSLIDAVNEALKGGQVKIDKNHNGKIDGQDFKMLRKEENIDEISLKTKIKAYAATREPDADYNRGDKVHSQGDRLRSKIVAKHGEKAGDHADRAAYGKPSTPATRSAEKSKSDPLTKATSSTNKMRITKSGVANKQDQKSNAAVIKSRIGKHGKSNLPEDIEQVDELSKQTMGSYIKKASHDVATKSAATGRYADRANAVKDQMKKGDYSNYQQGKKDDATADKMFNKSWKRRAGIAKATDKLTKEEVVDEAGMSRREAGAHWDANKTAEKKSDTVADYKNKTAYQKAALAAKKKVSEGVEQVDELSKATLGSYVNKSAASLGKAGYNAGSTDGTAAKLDPHIHTINKRSTGIKRAVGKLAKEDTQIDELSTDTYHSAAKKAAKRAMGDAQGRSGPIFKKYAGMANKFRDKGMSQEKKEKAMKEANTMTKVKTTKDIGYKVVDVGPGQKEKIVKAHNWTEPNKASRDKKAEKMKAYRADRDKHMEEEIQIDEISKGTLASYGYKAGRQMQGNQPSDPDKFRKRINREKGSKLAYGKYYGHKVKVPATEEAESVDELSKNTLGNYALAGVRDIASRQYALGKGDKSNTGKLMNRRKGVDKAISKLTKEATDPRDSRPETWRPNNTGYAWDKLSTRMASDPKDSKARKAGKQSGLKHSIKSALGSHGPKGKLPEETDPGFAEATENPMAKQLADKKAAIQKTIVQKKMQVMQSKANKQMSSMKEGKCSCTEGKKSMTCETHGDKAMGMKGGKEPILMNPPLRD